MGTNAQERLLEEWARYLDQAARKGALTKGPAAWPMRGVVGPRAGALEIKAGMDSPDVLKALAKNEAVLLRQFIPWEFTGEPSAYMRGRFVRVEAGWPDDLAEKNIRLSDLGANPKGGGRWIAGKNEYGATVITGLSDKVPHYLIAGATGSGKSVALRSAVLQLSRDKENRIVLVDGKVGEGLGELAHLPGVVGPVAVDNTSARAALGWAVSEMHMRYETRDYQGRVIVVVDEFQEWADDGVFVDLMRKLAAQGRAARVSLLAATQHPTVDAFGDPTVRRNLVGKIALRVEDPDASRVAVGGRYPRADWLMSSGDSYVIGPGVVQRTQMAYVTESDVRRSQGGEWLLNEWPELQPDKVGVDLPTGPGRPVENFSPREVAVALISANQGEGRPAMNHRLQEAGCNTTGAERGSRLLKWGREIYNELLDIDTRCTDDSGSSGCRNARHGG